MSSEITGFKITITPPQILPGNSAVGANQPSSNVLVSTPSRAINVGHHLWGSDLPNEVVRTPRARIHYVNHHESWFRPENSGSTVKLSVSPKNSENVPPPKAGDVIEPVVNIAASIEPLPVTQVRVVDLPRSSQNSETASAPKTVDVVQEPRSAPAGLALGLTPSEGNGPKSEFDIQFGKIRDSILKAKDPRRKESPFSEADLKALEIFLKFKMDKAKQKKALLASATGVRIDSFAIKRGTQFKHEGITYTLPRTVEFVFNFAKSKMIPYLALNVKTELTKDPTDRLVMNRFGKREKLAVDLETGETCIRTTALASAFGLQEIFLLNILHREVGAVPFYGRHEFTSKTGADKIAVYAPLSQALDRVDLSRLSLRKRLELIAPAFAFLERIHSGGNIHGNIHSGNIFIRNGKCMIAGFGQALSRFAVYRGFWGTLPFTAPEYLELIDDSCTSLYTLPTLKVQSYKKEFSADLWGMGIVLHNVLFNKMPDFTKPKDLKDLRIFFNNIKKLAPSIFDMPTNKDSVFALLSNLLQFDPEKRFTAKEALAKFRSCFVAYQERGWDVVEEEFQKERESIGGYEYDSGEPEVADDQKSVT